MKETQNRRYFSCAATVAMLSFLLAGCGKNESVKALVDREPLETPPDQVEAEVPAPTPVPAPPSLPVDQETFMGAALEGKLDGVGKALKAGNDPNAAGPDGRTALMLAAFNGHARVAELLIDAGANVKARDTTKRTALMYACTGPDVATVELLLKHGAAINAVDGHERWTPLMFAGAEGHIDVIRTLLKHGADATMKDVDGETARTFATQRGHQAVVALLAEAEKSSGK